MGGFSKVYDGTITGEEGSSVPILVGIKIRKKKKGDARAALSISIEDKSIDVPQDEDALKRKEPEPVEPAEIQREIYVLTDLQTNPYIMELISSIYSDDDVWIVTELGFASLLSVYTTIMRDVYGDYDVEVLIHLVAPIVDAINFVHSMGYVHGDIKMSNMMLNTRGIPKLDPSTGFAQYEPKGSEFHMAPEVVRVDPVGPKADAFAFGVTLSQLYVQITLEFCFGGLLGIMFSMIPTSSHSIKRGSMRMWPAVTMP